MVEAYEMSKEFDTLYHTHSSENKNEIKEVKKLFGKENIEYFDSIGVLSEKTLLAHCIHTNEEEVELLRRTETRVCIALLQI